MTTEYLGYEPVEPEEGFMQPARNRVRWRCPECGHKWSKIFKGAVPRDDPPCPTVKCTVARETAALRLQTERLLIMLEEQRAPAQIGANNVVKAVDQTAEIVMEDYKMSNLKDGVRQGESVAPKLDDPKKQALADNYFAPKGATPIISAPGEPKISMPAKQMSMLGRRAIAGAFRGMAVAPTAVTPNAAKGQPALTRVRTETIGGGRR